MNVVLWMTNGSMLRVGNWGPRALNDLTEEERRLNRLSEEMFEGTPGGFVLVSMLNSNGHVTSPVVVCTAHIMSVAPIDN